MNSCRKNKLAIRRWLPIHIINKSSVDDISTRSGESIQNLQFRPNIVLSGIPAFIEDRFTRLNINGSEWSFAKKCVRCIMTTLKPNEFIFNKEPLKHLPLIANTRIK